MKMYSKPEIDVIEIRSEELVMGGLVGSGEHGENAPAREPQQAPF